MSKKYAAIIIGAGHNGQVNAAYLACVGKIYRISTRK
jgi:phytoene dehydrogenase-like protein